MINPVTRFAAWRAMPVAEGEKAGDWADQRWGTRTIVADLQLKSLLQDLIEFFVLERSLILRTIRTASKGSVLKPYGDVMRWVAVINAHIWFFYMIGRQMPGSISYVACNLAAFSIWAVFSMSVKAVRNSGSNGRVTKQLSGINKQLNVKWVHLFIAAWIWHVNNAVLAFGIVFMFYLVCPVPRLGSPLGVPNIPMLLALFAIAAVLGAGFGLVAETARHRWGMHGTTEIFFWGLLVTSGVLHYYVFLPASAAFYLSFNPLSAPIEFARKALHSSYPVGDLTLAYPISVAAVVLLVGLLLRRATQRGSS